MADGRNALNFDPRLDSPYIRAAEEVPMIRYLLGFMDRVEYYESGAVRDFKFSLNAAATPNGPPSNPTGPVNLQKNPASGRPAVS